ncbi:unnamed protein product [Withania somnifera]
MVVLGVVSPQHILLSIPSCQAQMAPSLTRRKALIFTPSLLSSFIYTSHHSAATAFQVDLPQQEEDRLVHLFQETSPSVVFIKDLELAKVSNDSTKVLAEDENAKVEGTGSGFIWDKFGHIVTNYHVVTKLATDSSGLHRCKVSLVNAKGESIAKEAKIIGVDPAYDLAVLKVNVEGDEVKPVSVGTSRGLRVGQSCFAIGNPYGFENTLTTGVVSGLGREIPAPNGAAIKGAIQTDAAINAGSGMSSGVNFAIPIDTVVRTIPYLIVYGTAYKDRY